jgi:hypothetical protein
MTVIDNVTRPSSSPRLPVNAEFEKQFGKANPKDPPATATAG